jgi:hypothetical protein
MARSRYSPEKDSSPTIPGVLLLKRDPRPLPGEARRELLLHAAPLPGERDGRMPAACRAGGEDVGALYRVTERLLCRVPVANDVRMCPCGGVFSDLFNGRSLCRGCGRER